MKPRLPFVDGLRGVAAMAVVIYHLLLSPGQVTFCQVLPGWLMRSASYGRLGVQVFFVLSGFAIAYSLDRRVTLSLAARFALRRQLRLDPCYWVALLVAVGNLYWSTRLYPGYFKFDVTPGNFLIHIVYLQSITHAPPLTGVTWTLCIEVQFYLVYILMLLVTGKRAIWPVLGLAGVSLMASDLPWFLPHWYMFALGVLTAWVHVGQIHRCVLWAAMACALIPFGVEPLAAVLTALAIHLVGNRAWLSSQAFQFLGRISYPLYLLHIDVSWRVMGFFFKSSDVGIRMLGLGVSFAAVMAAATAVHYAVERPSLNLAARFK